jgi:hypothetical protein
MHAADDEPCRLVATEYSLLIEGLEQRMILQEMNVDVERQVVAGPFPAQQPGIFPSDLVEVLDHQAGA